MRKYTVSPWVVRTVRIAGAMAIVAALSGCIVAPYGPRYGYYHPYRYGYY